MCTALSLHHSRKYQVTSWLRITVDTGGARTVFPGICASGQKLRDKNPLTFQTATGEVVNSSGDFKLGAWDRQGSTMCCPGTMALVRTPVVTAKQVSDRDRPLDIWRQCAHHSEDGQGPKSHAALVPGDRAKTQR